MVKKSKHGYDIFGYGDEVGVLYNVSKDELNELLHDIIEQSIKNEMEVVCVK
jgi:hypothetical protein